MTPSEKPSSDVEKLTLPPVTSELLEAATAVEEAFSADPRYNTVEITEDRSAVVVWWHGDQDPALTELIAHSDVSVVVAASEYLPADLRAAANSALHSGQGVTAAWVPKEGNGIEHDVRCALRRCRITVGSVAHNTGPTVFAYGNNGVIGARTTSYDGAIINTGFNNPGFYTSTWDSSTYTALNGATFAPVGSEVCYSGSYSGLICGNIVQEHGVVYSLGGDPTSVIGMRTLQSSGTPGVGNGDSGGPGYALVNVSGTLKRYAVSIISAIPGGSPATCTGVPGDPAPGGRKCSATVFATSVPQIASALGWSLSTTP